MANEFTYLIASSVLVALLSWPLPCPGQYYLHYQPQGGQLQYTAQSDAQHLPYFQRYLNTDPKLIRRWNEHRRWLERDQLLRSPLNPESTLDYLLRTYY